MKALDILRAPLYTPYTETETRQTPADDTKMAATKRTLSVTFEGVTATRHTDCDYTHVVFGKNESEGVFYGSWHKSESAASKAARKYQDSKYNKRTVYFVVPV